MIRASVASLLLLAGCSKDQPAGPQCLGGAASVQACGAFDGLTAASDYTSSAVGAFDADGGLSVASGVDLGTDPALEVSRGRAFYIARSEDRLFELDPGCGAPRAEISVHHASDTGSSNPQDVAVAPDGSLWVPWYNVGTLLVSDACGAPKAILDLSSYDPDGNPEASAIRIVDTPGGSKAFVTLQVLDPDYGSTKPSLMLRIDVASATVDKAVTLQGRNPFSVYQEGTDLWLADPGNFDAGAEPGAGVEAFDTTTSSSVLLVKEADLGGSASDVAVTPGCGAAIVADSTEVNATSLVTFDPDAGTILRPASNAVLKTAGFDLQGLLWIGTTLYVGDRSPPNGAGYPIHAFTVSKGCVLTPLPDVVFLPLPPVALRAP